MLRRGCLLGLFAIVVGVALAPSAALAKSSARRAYTVPGNRYATAADTDVTVPATQDLPGVDTGLSVSAGTVLTLTASGTASYCPGCDTGPDGDPNHYDGNAIVSSAPVGTLLAAVVAPSSSPAWFPVGSSATVTTGPAGELYLIYNDVPGAFYNNAGSYSVAINLSFPSDPPLSSLGTLGPSTGLIGDPISVGWEFSDADPAALPSDFAASIAWGDGTTSSGTIQSTCLAQQCFFLVGGGHSYAKRGTFVATAHVTDVVGRNDSGGATVDIPATITIGAPQVDCYDGLFNEPREDFIDSRPAANYCATSARTRGFPSFSHHNAAAAVAAERLPNDSVFYFVGHAVGGCPGSVENGKIVNLPKDVGAALEFVAGSRESFLRGPQDDACIDVDPNTDVARLPPDLRKVSLVVLQACITLKDPSYKNPYESIGSEFRDAGARTVVGFTGEIGFDPFSKWGDYPGSYRPYGDAWAAGFWQGLAQGETVSQATDQALAYESRFSHGDLHGYDTVAILPVSHGGDRLSGSAARLAATEAEATAFRGSAARQQGPPPHRVARLTGVLRRFLNGRLPNRPVWRAQRGPRGTDYSARVPGVGSFVVDGSAYAVAVAVFDRHGSGALHSLSHRQAARRARRFALRHAGIAGFRLRADKRTGSGRFAEFFLQWQRRSRSIWLPSYVAVSVRRDGSIASYAREFVPVGISLRPRISRASALATAAGFAHNRGRKTVGPPGLALKLLPNGAQKLVWVVPLDPPTGLIIPIGNPVWVDAQTGVPTIGE